ISDAETLLGSSEFETLLDTSDTKTLLGSEVSSEFDVSLVISDAGVSLEFTISVGTDRSGKLEEPLLSNKETPHSKV
ncbi:14468_t:CDS:2, partial [Entrophospora sp. SA101]